MTLFVPQGCRPFVDKSDGGLTLNTVLVPMDANPSPTLALRAARSLTAALGIDNARFIACHIGSQRNADALPVDGAELVVREGSVANELLAAAKDLGADLIVMSTLGHNGILDAFRGSTTEQVLRQSPCPVLAVPATRAGAA